MQFKKSVKVQKQNKNSTLSISIPKPLVDILNIKPGCVFEFILDTDKPEELKINIQK